MALRAGTLISNLFMMSEETQISRLIERSGEVLSRCSLDNGAIVAANPEPGSSSRGAKDYRLVWLRDAMYVCRAADILDLPIRENYLRWCFSVENLHEEGMFSEKYAADGTRMGFPFQVDQAGSVLMTIADHADAGGDTVTFDELARSIANPLCDFWNGESFDQPAQDLWEERYVFPDMRGNFTYSLAMCAAGLDRAGEIYANKRWRQTSEEMRQRLDTGCEEYFSRSFGDFPDERIDASALGVLWPAGFISPKNARMRKTVGLIEKKLVRDGGVCRYEHDEYDGWMYEGRIYRRKGAGYWPLLTFWLSICLVRMGEAERARQYYRQVLHDLGDESDIPEQIFGNDIQESVSPLAWSHAMFVIASRELGYIS